MGNPALDLARLSREEQFELLDQLWETLGYVWYEAEREGLGEEFLVEVRATIGAVLDAPEAKQRRHEFC